MNIYKVEKEKNYFIRYLIVIAITIIATLFASNSIDKANEIDDFATRLSVEENKEKEVEPQINNVNITDNIENMLGSTVGISLLKPNDMSIFDVNVERKWGMGTGIIVSENGYILTNQHLAQKVGARIIVTLNSGKSVQGKIVWNQEDLDLAIVKIDEKGLIKAKLRRFR